MSIKMAIGQSGLEDLEQLFKELPKAVVSKAVKRTIRAANRVVWKEMKEELKNEFNSARVVGSVKSKVGRGDNMVGFTWIQGAEARRYGLPTNIGALLTFGHRMPGGGYYWGQVGKKWKERVWKKSEKKVVDLLTGDMTGMIDKELQKFHKNTRLKSHRKAKRIARSITRRLIKMPNVPT